MIKPGAWRPLMCFPVIPAPTTHTQGGAHARHSYPPGWGQAVRFDDWPTQWKAIRVDNGPMLLFNLTADIGEFHNINASHTDVVQRVAEMMAASHEDNKWWPSPKGQVNKQCCGSCFNPGGCRAPCFSPPAPPPGPVIPVPLRELKGVWRDSKMNQYNVTVDTATDGIVLTTVKCPLCHWTAAKGTVSPNGVIM